VETNEIQIIFDKTVGKDMENKPEIAEQLVEYLNNLLKLDPLAINKLIEYRTPCGKAFIEHPTVQVHFDGAIGNSSVGLLGILNGFVGANVDGRGIIVAHFNDFGEIRKFFLANATRI